MGMPGMQGYGNPFMNNPMMMSPYNGMPGVTQSPYGSMLGGYPSMMGLQSGGRLTAPVYGHKYIWYSKKFKDKYVLFF
uniref:Uncharacterized protein n=1 Tax=Panagrolaimus sp. PS1159 TaxID=55785 RepID=A0AC35FGR1_9BILA